MNGYEILRIVQQTLDDADKLHSILIVSKKIDVEIFVNMCEYRACELSDYTKRRLNWVDFDRDISVLLDYGSNYVSSVEKLIVR